MKKKCLLMAIVGMVALNVVGCADPFPSKRDSSTTTFYHTDEDGNKIVEKVIVEKDGEKVVYKFDN